MLTLHGDTISLHKIFQTKKERLGCRSFLGNEKMKNYFVILFDDEFIIIRKYD